MATNVSYIASRSWTNAGDYTVTFTAYNTDNAAGVSTNVIVQVLPLESPDLTADIFINSTFNLEFASQSGVTCMVEEAANLVPPVVWSTVNTRGGTGSTIQINDATATNEMRFYRVHVP